MRKRGKVNGRSSGESGGGYMGGERGETWQFSEISRRKPIFRFSHNRNKGLIPFRRHFPDNDFILKH